MKLRMYFLLLALGALTLTLQSCDDDDDKSIPVPAELQNALVEKHGDAQRIEWEMKGTYFVADFYVDNYEKEAWFTIEVKCGEEKVHVKLTEEGKIQ